MYIHIRLSMLMLTCDVSCFAVVRSSVFVPLQNKLHHMDNKAVLILNNRLFMVPHLVRAWSAYKGLNTLILSHTHTHLCRCITGDRLIECITGDGLVECITGDGLVEWEERKWQISMQKQFLSFYFKEKSGEECLTQCLHCILWCCPVCIVL